LTKPVLSLKPGGMRRAVLAHSRDGGVGGGWEKENRKSWEGSGKEKSLAKKKKCRERGGEEKVRQQTCTEGKNRQRVFGGGRKKGGGEKLGSELLSFEIERREKQGQGKKESHV